MKSLGIGIAVFCMLTFVGLIAGDAQLVINLTGGAALILLVLAIIFSGSLGSGDRIRANYSNENSEERKRRNRLTSSLVLMSIPNVLGTIIVLSFQ